MYPSTEGALAPHVPLGGALPNDSREAERGEGSGAYLTLLGSVGGLP